MLLGLYGKTCAGKYEVACYLKEKYDFRLVKLISNTQTSTAIKRDENGVIQLNADDLMQFVLQDGNWENNWIVWPIESSEDLNKLRKRPFFFLLGIDAPVLLRYSRFQFKNPQTSKSITKFVEDDEVNEYSVDKVSLRNTDAVIFNVFDNMERLHASIDSIDPILSSKLRLRPCWDDYFMLLSDLAAHRSNCMKRRVGCILVRDFRVVATGYNGTPRGVRNCNQGGCSRCNDGNSSCGQNLSECLCMHAEENALLEAGRDRIDRPGSGHTTLYCNTW